MLLADESETFFTLFIIIIIIGAITHIDNERARVRGERGALWALTRVGCEDSSHARRKLDDT